MLEYVRFLKRDLSFRCWLQEQLKSLAVRLRSLCTAADRNSHCRSSVRQRLPEQRGSQAEAGESASCGGCRRSLSRLLWAFKMRAAALGAQLLQEQRETEAAGAARVAGGGCVTSYRQGLQVQLESHAPEGSSCGST